MHDLISASGLILSLNGALSGEITPNMRAALISLEDTKLQLRVIYYSQPSEDEIETMNVVGGEVIADFGEDKSISERYEVMPAGPITLSEGEYLVYRRKD